MRVNVAPLGYNSGMPVPTSVVAAIVNSVINAVASLPPATQETSLIAMARSFPQDSKLGELAPPIQRELMISGNTYYASPGMQLRGPNNLIVMPSTFQSAQPVRFQLDAMGNVHRIWILSAAEVAAAKSQ